MNEQVFSEIKKAVERKGIYYGEIVITCQYHDGAIRAFSITTTERVNCNKNAKHAVRQELDLER